MHEEQEESELIGSVAKNETTTIQVRRVTYKEATWLDIREYVESENYQGPTKKGIRVITDILPEIQSAIERSIQSNIGQVQNDPYVDANGFEAEEAELIASISKNETTTIQIRKVTYKGQNYFDIREFVDSENYQGPTKKGIRIHGDLLNDLAVLIKS